tara:strand:- start:2203 stop:3534 length:1332 start_codon:yes stop_codon:yes gene_type:complete
MFNDFIVSNFKKIILIIFGLFLLVIVSKSLISILIIFIFAIISFIIATNKKNIKDSKKVQLLERNAVPIAFIILIIFNIFGIVKTLTGTIEEKQNISLLFVGVTFYILSAGAYISDYKFDNTQNYKNEFINFFLYLVLPFKLLAGPLENPQLINQFKNISFNFLRTSRNLYCFSWISVGLFMKFVIGSRLTPSELLNFTDPLGSFICAFIFELKFYFDFAGYSLIVFGLARLFNLKITLNFNHPFTAKNVVEFWHKWHVSLGKFLQRYILIKHVNFLKNRLQKALFASFIFVISAMWHGGTLNYLFWGLFHGIIYLFYIQYFKNKNINKIFGYFGMFLFFVFGRMIAIDINSGRLIEKWYNYFSFNSYSNISLNQINELFILGTSTKSVFIIFFIFIIFEFWQVKIMKRSSYHFFRRPIMSVFFFIVTILFGFNSMELLYARI